MSAPAHGPGILVLSGNPRPASRTSALAQRLGAALAPRLGLEPDAVATIELAELADQVLVGGNRLAAARERVAAADLLIVATPVYKGAYTGLLKSFLDTYDAGALAGRTAAGIVVAGQEAHLGAGEVHLRPVLLELGLSLPAPVLAVPQARVTQDEPIAAWLRAHGDVLVAAAHAATAGVARVPAGASA